MPPKTRSSEVPTLSDVIIIGAGWYGLSATKTFLAVNSSATIRIIDNGDTIGGVWSKSRVYPRLVLNQPTPHMEYSDLSMSEVAGGLEDYSDIPGDLVTKYIETYAEKKDLLKLCQFNTHVVSIERKPDLGPWRIITRPADNPDGSVEGFQCTKLIVATGHKTVPNMPSDLDLTSFSGTVFHAKELGKRHDEIANDESIKSVTVVGGNKSAFEIAANFGLARKKVIRSSVLENRFQEAPRVIQEAESGQDEAAVRQLIEEGDGIKISHTHISSMNGRTLHLANNEAIAADAVIFGTGWKHPYPLMFSPSLSPDLGIPSPPSSQSLPYREHWSALDTAAEQEILTQYPILAHPPQNLNLHLKPAAQCARFFRFMVPPTLAAQNDHTIIFLGNLHAQSTPLFSEICALWAVAYLEDLFPANSPINDLLKDRAAMEREAARSNAWARKRHLSLAVVPMVTFEMREVIDLLLRDLGVEPERHRMKMKGFGWWGWKGWCREWFTGYSPVHYRGVLEQFLEAVERGKGK
ncbi:FAD/NAD(P)-binding domain-containing protein [Hyaloscypha variabilis F]|uniref:FAD/NAD(P)-binding domain-containing protein n=1 Tax=Hyaloscypha variabilis (strain UAMH 11265 / GT02V1 / F) TaxID=1149755 RepID=A0A2J6RJW1_HYAVF|nr:FAD/NAD(P)-binding domain-containing protein [Hyaloscypha variabilis F]